MTDGYIKPHEFGQYVQVAPDVIPDLSSSIDAAIRLGVRRWAAPWEFPDPNPFPHFDLFPRATAGVRRVVRARDRVVAAWHVLRYGPDHLDWED